MSELKIISWNARGICSKEKRAEVEMCTNVLRPGLFLIQESFLNSENSFYVPNYTVVRGDRSSHGGGLVILVKKGLRFNIHPAIQMPSIEHLMISIRAGGTILNVSNVYSPKNTRSTTADLRKLMLINNHLCIGDFNAKHPSWSVGAANPAGTKLFNLLPLNNVQVLTPSSHTYCSSHGTTSTLDFALCNATFNVPNPEVVNSLFSDHYGVQFKIGTSLAASPKLERDFERANWAAFGQSICDAILQIEYSNDPTSLDSACNRFSEALIHAQDIAIPLIVRKDAPATISSKPMRLIRTKNAINRQLTRTTDTHERSVLKSQVNQLKTLIKDQTTADRNENWGKFVRNASKSPSNFWAAAKKKKSATNSPVFHR